MKYKVLRHNMLLTAEQLESALNEQSENGWELAGFWRDQIILRAVNSIFKKEENLTTCPFCKTRGSLEVLRDDLVDYFVNCKYCGANGPHERTSQDARAAWNKR